MLCILDFVATFVGCSDRELCANAGKTVSSRFTVNSANPQEDLANGRPECSTVIPFLVFVLFFEGSHQFPGAIPSPRSDTGLEDELDESCGGDVEDETLPGTTRGTKLSVLHMIVFPSLVNRDF